MSSSVLDCVIEHGGAAPTAVLKGAVLETDCDIDGCDAMLVVTDAVSDFGVREQIVASISSSESLQRLIFGNGSKKGSSGGAFE